MDATTIISRGNYVGGSGKYEGMSGSFTSHGPEFKVAAGDTTYVVSATYEATYKLK